jgi:hypothetical protein
MPDIHADATVSAMGETHRVLCPHVLEALVWQWQYAARKDETLTVGKKVSLSTRQFQITRLSKRLDYKRTRPYTVSKIMSKNAYKLHLPPSMWNHNVFQILRLIHQQWSLMGQILSETHWMIVDYSHLSPVKQKLVSQQLNYMPHMVVQGARDGLIQMSCELFRHLGHAGELISKFHWDYPNKLQRWRQMDPRSGAIDGRSGWLCQLGISCQFLWLGPGPVQMASARR